MVPVASAGRVGKGRVAAFGHGAYFSAESIKVGETGRLLQNVLQWASGRTGKVRVGHLDPSDQAWLNGLGFETFRVTRGTIANDLNRVDVLVMQAGFEHQSVEAFVRAGGGLVTGHTPWGWMQLNPQKDLASEMPLQSLLHKAGLAFSDGTAEQVWPAKSFEESQRNNASWALRHLATDGQQASSILMATLRSTTPQIEINRNIRTAVSESPTDAPSAANPLTSRNSLARLSLTIRHLDRSAAKSVPKIEPSSTDFPGPVPTDAPRVETSLMLPVDVRQWVSTGLYAAPGEGITIESSVVMSGVSIQIGCHSDSLWHLDQWQRHPEITVRRILTPGVMRMSSPFGGLVYLVVDRPQTLPIQTFTFDNVVRSARYVHGKTSREDWANQLKHQAPWAEIGSDKVIFSVPIADARKVKDPVALMDLWDKSLELYSDLDGRPLPNRPERIVCDRQISAGYMHSGYPIMTWMDKSIEMSLNVESLTSQGTWGHWHELGHNHQKPEWTFAGTGEVTCNLYALYLMEKVAGKKLWDRIGNERSKLPAYFAKGGDFAQWKSEPFLALTMYAQLVEAFGWDALKKYLRSYESEDFGRLPKTDDEKRDQFLIRYSKVVGKNLGPFFQKWGVPTSVSARSSLNSLPTWIPKS